MKIANYDLLLDKGWKFHLGDVERFKEHVLYVYDASKAGGYLGNVEVFKNKNSWQDVRVPHDWMMSLPVDPSAIMANGFKQRGMGWYYVNFKLGEEDIDNARLVFEGVLGQTTVYVNGTVAARNFSGYNRFTCEIASYLEPGKENMIALCVDTTTWEAWSYEGAGLYRPAYIEFRESTKLDTYGCFVRGNEKDGVWEVVADIKTDGCVEGTSIISTLTDPNGNEIARAELQDTAQVTVRFPVQNARLWSPEHPTLYKFNCRLVRSGEILDTLCVNVGLRTITWHKDTGMHLNGTKYMVKGICCHQDHGGVGAAVTPELMEFRVKKLKKMGANSYRCAHHAVPDSLLDICDRLGMMVMVENRHFSVSEDTKYQLESLVKLARNHPCVFIYSLFNEEPWQAERRGYLMAKKMREWVLALDDTRACTGAMNGGVSASLNAAYAMDVVGLNYYNAQYPEFHALNPDKAVIGTENCPTYATRGVYVTDEKKQEFNCYGDHWADFAISVEETVKSVHANEFCAGCFPWSGFDSYGEPVPCVYPSVMSHWGFMDICGFEKDTAYLLAAWYKDELCAHLLPHWNWAEGESVRVCVFTNADRAALFVNGVSVGEKDVNDRRAEWNVPFNAGKICVVASRGKEQVTDEISTAGKLSGIRLCDVTPKGDGNKIRIINVSAVDKNGTVLPNCDAHVYVDALATEVLGIANGDPNGTQANIAYDIKLFHGRAQIIVTAESKAVTVRCEGLEPVTV
ncbi:MAG: glycoside hydrolase family 2 protein [Ruminococcaceae bacterium]|nr:glycoside hydrolase family 2 protein [Oscillospiraceae bacterium]